MTVDPKALDGACGRPAESNANRPFNVRMTDEERAMLKDIAEHVGLSASDVVRQFVRARHAKLFGSATKSRRKK